MKLETTIGKRSRYDLARKRYHAWMWRSKEGKMYKAILFVLTEGKCPVCKVDMVLAFNDSENKRPNSVTLDHTIPLDEILEHNKMGLEIMCKRCNSLKGNANDRRK